MKLDLHTHSTLSDGTFSPGEIVDMACNAGFKVLAITDHDSIASFELAQAALRGRDLALIPGVEISAACGEEELHILAYFRFHVPQAIRDFLQAALLRREERALSILAALRKRGVPLELEDVKSLAKGESVSRAHIAQAMVARGLAASIEEAFDLHLHYRHGIVPLALTTVEEAIGLVVSAGGIAVWAHPPAMELEERLARFVKAGLRGIEAYRRRTHGVKTARLVELGDSHGIFVTAGSDWHGHGGQPLADDLSFPPSRLRPFLREFGLDHLSQTA